MAIITQYGSTVYIGIARSGPALYIAIHKEISVFTFSLNLTLKDIRVENR